MAVTATVAVAGCRSSEPVGGHPHAYRASQHAIQVRHDSVDVATIVVGTFDNPATASVRWRSIGSGVAADLARTLRVKTGMQVWADTGLARSAITLTTRGVSNRTPWLETLQRRHPGVEFVIVGKVTDFVHTSDVPQVANQKRGRYQALVAIDFTAIEVRTGRILAQNQVVGKAGEREMTSADQYKGLAFGSYLFWETPLGIATRQAIDRTAAEIARSMPAVLGEAVVSTVRGDREVEVSGGELLGLRVGQVMYLTVGSDPPIALRDVDTRAPLTVRITSVDGDAAEGWVSGICDDQTRLRGARLTTTLPVAPPTEREPDELEANSAIATARARGEIAD